jgi:hypothetical protein
MLAVSDEVTDFDRAQHGGHSRGTEDPVGLESFLTSLMWGNSSAPDLSTRLTV